MKTNRVIPRLDIKGPNLVKGIHLEGLRALGHPSDFAQFYYQSGADEIMFMDVVASLYERNSLHNIISETASSIFIPITVGGGIRTLEDIRKILRCGADKVSINTAALKNPQFIHEASREFGSSTIVIAIEAIKGSDGLYTCFIDNGREFTGVEVSEWAKKVEDLGCGEIIITSVDREGTGKGFDLDLIQLVMKNVSVPVICHGGAGSMKDILDIFNANVVDSVAISSILHYEALKHIKSVKGEAIEGNFEFINSGRKVGNLDPVLLSELKKAMKSNNIISR
jgi:cyclase